MKPCFPLAVGWPIFALSCAARMPRRKVRTTHRGPSLLTGEISRQNMLFLSEVSGKCAYSLQGRPMDPDTHTFSGSRREIRK